MDVEGPVLFGSLRRARGVVAAVAIVLGFLGVDVIAQARAREIDRFAQELQVNAVPSIDRLTAARGDLERITIAARKLAASSSAPRKSADRASYEDALTRLARDMSAYVELPVYPGEAALRQLAAKDLGVYENLAEAFSKRLYGGDAVGAIELMDKDLAAATDRVDGRLQSLVELNAEQVGRAGDAIRRARQSATALSYALHGLAALLAVLTLWAVALSNKSYEKLVAAQARLDRERTELAEMRAAELDLFAARVAHDLKNPLGAIRLGVESAQRKAEEAELVQKSLGRAQNAIERANEIIDGLLEFARAGGNTRDNSSVTDLGEAIESAVAQMALEVEQSGVQLTVDPIAVPVQVACSEGQLLSVLGNLVGNAVKYVVEGSSPDRRVGVRVLPHGPFVRVEVDDTGPGIPLTLQASIFEPYVRGAHTRRPGLGLGLATVKRIVEANGGSVGVRSTVGQGSAFWIELPQVASAAASTLDRAELH